LNIKFYHTAKLVIKYFSGLLRNIHVTTIITYHNIVINYSLGQWRGQFFIWKTCNLYNQNQALYLKLPLEKGGFFSHPVILRG